MTNFTFERHKFAYERHKKACKTCERHDCSVHCKTCDISPLGDVRSCPCLSWGDGKKYSRCKYYKPVKGGQK